jgi:hypothetical protein
LHQRWSQLVQNIHLYSPWCCVELNAGGDVQARSVLFTTHGQGLCTLYHTCMHTCTHVCNNWSNGDCNINYSRGSNGLCKMQVRTADLANSLVKDSLHGWIWWVQQIVYLFMHTWDVCPC